MQTLQAVTERPRTAAPISSGANPIKTEPYDGLASS